jgi:hypothetical protein
MWYTSQRRISRSVGREKYSRGSDEWKKKEKEDHRGTEYTEKKGRERG